MADQTDQAVDAVVLKFSSFQFFNRINAARKIDIFHYGTDKTDK